MTHACTSLPATTLKGAIRPPGDKSISHRAIILGTLAIGATRIEGLLESEDVLATIAACRQLGARIEQRNHHWYVEGVGLGGLTPPQDILDMGNAGTACRLMMGMMATHPIRAFFSGDRSLRQRPMARVIDPLEQFGAKFFSTSKRLPLMLEGASQALPIEYTLPVASAQVKSAVLLAGLNTTGITTVIEPVPTRDHTERMLPLFGVGITVDSEQVGNRIVLQGHQELSPADISIPADISSAAFAMVAAAIVPGAEVSVQYVMDNPTRNGILLTLQEMGADIHTEQGKPMGGEKTLNITVRQRALSGITVPAERVASMVDEFPVLAVAAACAQGETLFQNIGELRVKESDRLEETAKMLRLAGVTVDTGEDWMKITGTTQLVGGGEMLIHGDHRLAMSTLVLGAVCAKGMRISDYRHILTSYPNFIAQMNYLGMVLSHAD